MELQQVAGSYKDPSGYVFERDGEIFRAIANVGAPHFEASRDILSELAAEGRVVSFSEIDPTSIGLAICRFVHTKTESFGLAIGSSANSS